MSGRFASGCSSLFGLVALAVACLPLIGLAVLAGWGAILLITAHPVHPIPTTGVVVEAADAFTGNDYEGTGIRLQGEGRNYRVYRPGLHPPIPANQPQTGARIALWFDPDTNWGNLSETRVLALSLAGEDANRAAHRLDDFDNPESAAMRQRLVGAGTLALVALIVGLSALWERFVDRGSPHLPVDTRT